MGSMGTLWVCIWQIKSCSNGSPKNRNFGERHLPDIMLVCWHFAAYLIGSTLFVCCIYLYMWFIFMVNVGKSIPYMDPMGTWFPRLGSVKGWSDASASATRRWWSKSLHPSSRKLGRIHPFFGENPQTESLNLTTSGGWGFWWKM